MAGPTKSPRVEGVQHNTHRRDTEHLPRSLWAGELEGIHVLVERDEALSDLTRARSDASWEVKRVKQRLNSLLLRQGFHDAGRANSSKARRRYLREWTIPSAILRAVPEENLQAIAAAEERLQRL